MFINMARKGLTTMNIKLTTRGRNLLEGICLILVLFSPIALSLLIGDR